MESPWIERWALPCIVGAFVAGTLFAGIEVKQDWELGWETLSAIGTIAAAWAAVWISLKDDRRREEAALTQAQLIAATNHLPVSEICKNLAVVQQGYAEAILVDPNEDVARNLQKAVAQVFRDVTRLDLWQMNCLAPMPDRLAYRLARAHGLMRTCDELAERALFSYKLAGLGIDRGDLQRRVHYLLGQALKQMLVIRDRFGDVSYVDD